MLNALIYNSFQGIRLEVLAENLELNPSAAAYWPCGLIQVTRDLSCHAWKMKITPPRLTQMVKYDGHEAPRRGNTSQAGENL